MESFLGFAVPISDDAVPFPGDDSFSGYKLVPWISWDDWRFVKNGLFSSSPHSIASSLRRVSAWRSRGCVPVVVEVTASIIEIQQKDPFFRDDVSENLLHSDEMLSMLYSMAIMRLVNGVVEKTRKKNEVSIGEAAEALNWLKSYYWDPQTIAISSNQTVNVKKEIKSLLRELLLSCNVKQSPGSNSTIDKEKRPKKQINKILKSFSRLHSSYSPEVVSVLLRLLLKASDSVDTVMRVKNPLSHSASSLQTALDDWKPVIIKLLNREPELLVTLLRGILDMIETLESGNYDIEAEHFRSVEAVSEIEQLCKLFEWLVISCKGLKAVVDKESAVKTSSSTDLVVSHTTLVEYLRRCLKLSSGNNQLMKSALIIAHMTGNSNLTQKLKKLSSINNLTLQDENEIMPSVSSERYLSQQEDHLRKAAEKLEGFKQRHVKNVNANATDGHVGSRSVWVVAKSWKPCSIGMLPSAVGSSAHLPVLDCDHHCEEAKTLSVIKELPEVNHSVGKREADCSVENLDITCHKKVRGSNAGLESEDSENQSLEGEYGHLMLGGVWKKVREDEILDIASEIRILI